MSNTPLRSDWNQRPFIISSHAINHILAKDKSRIAKLKVKYGPAELKPKASFWNRHTFYLFCAWVAFAGAFTGLAFVAASLFDHYRALPVSQEMWTQDRNGHLVPMKEKGK